MESIVKINKLLEDAEELTGKSIPAFSPVNCGEPMTITIYGQPQNNLLGLILQQFDDNFHDSDKLNNSFIHGYRCTVRYGEEKKFYIMNDGKKLETTEETLYNLLMSFGELGEAFCFEMIIPTPALEKLSINIVASDDEFNDVKPDEASAESDYCFMTLNALAVLSMCERRFLRNVLFSDMKNVMGVLVLNIEMIPETEKKNVEDTISGFFKEFDHFYYPTEDKAALKTAMESLDTRFEELRNMRNNRIYQNCIQNLLKEVEEAVKVFTADEDYLSDAVELMREKAKQLPSRKNSASRNCRMRYTSAMKIEYATELSVANQKISNQLHEEINKGEDIEKMANIIPGYIKNEWERQTDAILASLKDKVSMMELELTNDIENDVYEFLGSGENTDTAAYIIRLTKLYSEACYKGEAGVINIERAKNYKNVKKGGALAAGIGLVLIGHPLIGAGVAVYSLAKVGETESLKALNKDRNTLIAEADKICTAGYESASEWLEQLFIQINENINTCVDESYDKLMDGMLAAIRARREDAENKSQVLNKLKQLETEIKEAVGK